MSKTKATSNFDKSWVTAGAEDALRRLTEAGDQAPQLVQAWVDNGNAAAVVEAAAAAERDCRKAARRGLNVLKSRGVTIPKRAAKPSSTKSEPIVEAYMLAPDAAGTVALVITSHTKASKHDACFAFVRDGVGVLKVETAELSQSGLKDAFKRLIPGAPYRPVKVPVPWVRARIASALAVHDQRGMPKPLGVASAQPLLEPTPSEAPAHPFDDEGLALGNEDANELAKDSGEMHNWPEFRSWFPVKQAVDEMLLKVGETLDPNAEPDQTALQKTLEAEVIAATDRYFSPERREDLVRCMKDSALSVLGRDGEQAALRVVATMQAIASRGLITDAPSELPFLRAFFDKALALLAAQSGGSLRIPIRPKLEGEDPEGDAINEASLGEDSAVDSSKDAYASGDAGDAATPDSDKGE